ncbi:MAG: TldD/PmbA family protein [Symbiobacteriaceae bacterium]|nr:TldD/PmbA family protein [Symbiobacteriaceae bacterium]
MDKINWRAETFETVKAFLLEKLNLADVDYCEIRIEDSRDLQIMHQGQALEQVRSNNLFGGNVRALYHGGWGFATFNDLDDLEANLRLACDQAKAAGALVQEQSQLAEVPVVVEDVCPNWTLHPEAVSLDEKVRILGHYQQLVLSYPNIPSCSVFFQERCTTVWFVNSEGTAIRQEKVDTAASVTAHGRKGDVSVSPSVATGSSQGLDHMLNLDQQIKEMCELTQNLLDAPPMKAGVYTVICDPAHTGLFVHEAFGHLSEADDLAKSPGFLKAMSLGRVLGKPILDIYETGEFMHVRGGLIYDDEGVACKRADLVKEGVLVGRLHNRWSAAKLAEEGTVLTGSARAINYIFPPIVRMRNTCIGIGESSFEDMLKDVKLGVYAIGSGGGQTNGEMFNFAAHYAYMIRDGKLAELVRDVKLMGNVFTTLENIDMVGNDLGPFGGGAGGCGKGSQSPLPTGGVCPHIRIQNVILGGVKE